MREEYIEIVDEIAGESALENQFYDEVRRVIEQTKNPAAARKPDMTIWDSDSEHESVALPNGDNDEISDGDQKIAAVDKTPDKHRKEAAKVMASLRKNHTSHDTGRQEAQKEAPKKAHQPNMSKKRRASTVVTSGHKIIPIHPGKKRKRGKKHGKQEIEDFPNPKDETICHAGLECRQGDINVVAEGSDSNGALCSKCQHISFCLFVSVSRRQVLHRLLQRTCGVPV